MRILLDGLIRIVAVGRAWSGEDAQHQRILRIRQQPRSPVQQRRRHTPRHQVRLDEICRVHRDKRMSALVLRAALWNYFLCSGSDFWKVTVPVPTFDTLRFRLRIRI